MSDSLLSLADSVILGRKLYRDFIHEAFIAPIRTAVVVDDEFPTLDEFLENPSAAQKKPHKDKAEAIIKFCRGRQPFPWIVDVHDGKNISLVKEGKSATLFDHTDLLVLDYNLRGENEGGELAINLLSQLASNTHFNLVIIYTNSDVSQTLRDVGMGLTSSKRVGFLLKNSETDFLQKTIEAWDSKVPDILNELINSVDDLDFLKYISSGVLDFSRVDSLHGFDLLMQKLNESPVKFKLQNMFHFILAKKYASVENRMSSLDLGDLEIDEIFKKGSATVNWVRADSLFITVVKKSKVMPEDFANCLIEAIEGWDPSPHRLIISKMRNEIGKRGAVVEKEILQNPYLQSAWVRDFFIDDELSRRSSVQRNISRHWESFGNKVESSILDFAMGLGEHLLLDKVDAERFDKNKIAKDASLTALYVNGFVCSKAVEGHHIFTGHVLKTETGEFWVCLTPACDLEPDQKKLVGPNKHLGSWLPFKAAQIMKMPSYDGALPYATRGYHLFLKTTDSEIDEAPSAYTFFSDPGVDQSSTPTLRWQQFYAKEQGVFSRKGAEVVVARSIVGDTGLTFNEQKCEVVAQLRYEYALNLLQKLGGHLSRVGLDFVNPSSYID
ncbi:response regulator receiver domain [Pseudomonas viridiflava]|uniref:response regulator receiver domain n=3 Tax=Pseudomonas viridiflava TaxID=33069 RepID=UPI000F03A4E1|nr:response regulator receiver domain [Pseudomonas viridiflava]